MGTTVRVDLADDLPNEDLARLVDDVFGWLHRVERLLSAFRPDSELSRLRRGDMRLGECAPETRLVIDRCDQLNEATRGYFDAYATGALDPAGYVKGWAVQVASDRLVAAGCANHRIDAGGDVRVRGVTPAGKPWSVAIRNPWERLAVSWVVTGTDLAVATSGSYELGPRIVDPHRGQVATRLRSVTVVGHNLGIADAYSTAGLAMGMAALRWLAGLAGHEAAVIDEDGRRYRSEGLPAGA